VRDNTGAFRGVKAPAFDANATKIEIAAPNLAMLIELTDLCKLQSPFSLPAENYVHKILLNGLLFNLKHAQHTVMSKVAKETSTTAKEKEEMIL
jgi:hypothetical protein